MGSDPQSYLAANYEIEHRNCLREINALDSACRDLTTIIDLCYAASLGIDQDDAIADLHDMAHVLAGGDRVLRWRSIPKLLEFSDRSSLGIAWPDVKRRGIELLTRLEKADAAT